jgi:Domain of unknown function (DUF4406)
MRRPFRIYIAGPCTGIPNENKPAFLAAELQMRGMGFDVVNPTTLPAHAWHDQSWASFMRCDIPALCTCDAVALLPGWESSKGANVERTLALALGMGVRPLAGWLKPDHFSDAGQMVGAHRPAPQYDHHAAGACPEANSVCPRAQCRCEGCADGSCPGRAAAQRLPADGTEGGAA